MKVGTVARTGEIRIEITIFIIKSDKGQLGKLDRRWENSVMRLK
jgi:hypothetical protein